VSGAAVLPGYDAVAAMARHIPVMRSEALGALGLKPGGRYLDGTFGAGGYTSEMLHAFADLRVLALDRDPTAIAAGQPLVADAGGRLRLVEASFSDLGMVAEEQGFAPLDGIVLDIGVSSMQFDEAERGFSFRADGPLDMRMAASGDTAADLVNEASEARLADILFHYGEERLSRPIARAIVKARAEGPITGTRQLSDIVCRVIKPRFGEIHPATRTFQALRIAVNDELGELARALHAAETVLAPGGRLVVVTFHSLEDRIVKQFFAARSGRGGGSRHHPVQASAATFLIEGRWPAVPEEDEIAFNPRARSAKLRCGLRTAEPAQPGDDAIAALASLPERSERGGSRKRTR
jgi:16S rRNA (cytosine1402-N4)-methyltransferase